MQSGASAVVTWATFRNGRNVGMQQSIGAAAFAIAALRGPPIDLCSRLKMETNESQSLLVRRQPAGHDLYFRLAGVLCALC